MKGHPRKAKGRPRAKPGQMNKLEKKYADHLDSLLFAGDILAWQFQPLKVKLAKATFYTPDFLVQEPDTTLTMVDVKGHWEDDARVKIKVAAQAFPFWTWKGVSWKGGHWQDEVIVP